MAIEIKFYDIVGRRTGFGSWEHLKISAYRHIQETLREGRWDDAAKLSHYFVDEASAGFSRYRRCIRDASHPAFQKAACRRDRGHRPRGRDQGRLARRRCLRPLLKPASRFRAEQGARS